MSGHITEKEKIEIMLLALSGDILNKDIAKKIGRNPANVSYVLRKLGVKNLAKSKIVGKWNSKHSHLRKEVMTYFLNHSTKECMEKFKLSKSEIKSLFTVGYRLPEFKHLRKDSRRHDAWSAKEYRFLLAHAGLMPRDWIAKKLKRGSHLGIKDRLELLGVSSQNLNGLTLSKFRVLFGHEPKFYLHTKAGPRRGFKNRENSASYYKIVPWVWMKRELDQGKLKPPTTHRQLIESMALFQEWVHGKNALSKLKRICQ